MRTSLQLDHLAIRPRNFHKSLHFYEKTIGLPIIRNLSTPVERIVWFDIGNNTSLELLGEGPWIKSAKVGLARPIFGFSHFSLLTTEFDKTLKALKRKGVRMIQDVQEIEGRKSVLFAGPDDEQIQLMEMKKHTDDPFFRV